MRRTKRPEALGSRVSRVTVGLYETTLMVAKGYRQSFRFLTRLHWFYRAFIGLLWSGVAWRGMREEKGRKRKGWLQDGSFFPH